MVDPRQTIEQAVKISRLNGFTGQFEALGGGEVNDTFLLTCDDQKYILRITRRAGRDTLLKEVRALSLFRHPNVPEVIFFDANQPIEGHYWVIESHLKGVNKTRLNIQEFKQLGRLLAEVHKVKSPERDQLNLWQHFLYSCRSFGDESSLLHHDDERLRSFINKAQKQMQALQPQFDSVQSSLVHGDATPSNILVNGTDIQLIDWEFARFSDPMMEFSTIYYEDMEFNQGKWRIQITPGEKSALFSGYVEAGGALDEKRISFWMSNDKLGAAVYLYWKLNYAGEHIPDDELEQNKLDMNNLLASLERNSG
jgi:aminoglycoside phosphotransferase (APT) family kinase protein